MTQTIQTAPYSVEALDQAIESAAEALIGHQQPDGHWVFALEADATIPAE